MGGWMDGWMDEWMDSEVTVQISVLGPAILTGDFLCSSTPMPGYYLKVSDDRFFSYPFQFIIH
jgi:hypothetical protein